MSVGYNESIIVIALLRVSIIADISSYALFIHEQSELVSLLNLPDAKETIFDKDESIFVKKPSRLVRDALLSSLKPSDGSSKRFCSVSFCVESSCCICCTSDFIASRDTAVVVVSEAVVDAISSCVVDIGGIVEVPEKVVGSAADTDDAVSDVVDA